MRLSSLPANLRVQVAVMAVGTLSVAALVAVLIRDVAGRTEDVLLGEARAQALTACRELRRQFEERQRYGDETLEALPPDAREVSLRGLAETVLRAYEGMEGGFVLSGEVVAHVRPPQQAAAVAQNVEAERSLVREAAERAPPVGESSVQSESTPYGLVVVAITRLDSGQSSAWTLKRLAGLQTLAARRKLGLSALTLLAVLGAAGTVSIWISLRRGLARLKQGLRRMEARMDYRLPAVGGDFSGIALAVNQMADRRAVLETELRRKDRLAALGKLVAGVAHEIRNPLNSMRLTLELLGRKVTRGSASASDVSAAQQEIDRLDAILARLLHFGLAVPFDPQLQALEPLFNRAVGMVREQARQKSVSLVVEAARECRVHADASQLEQVLINLLLNAVEASPPGGVVKLSAHNLERGCRIQVQDNGTGIAKHAREHVFDAFFTTRAGGSGLGLAVSREIIDRHGGDLSFTSSPQGTTFEVMLPSEVSNRAS